MTRAIVAVAVVACIAALIAPAAAGGTCLDTPAAMQCAADFSSCDSIGANKCTCFDALRVCFAKAGCSQSVLHDMAIQCTTAGCNAATCTGQSADVAVVYEAPSTCLDTAAGVQCDADFSSCDSIGANKCECFDALRECYTKASCSAAVMWDMATQCTTAGCNAATCTGQSADVAVEPEAASTCLDTAAVAQCDADFSSCDSIGANKCECFDALRECYTKASCSAAVLHDMAIQCTTAGCNAATCTGQSADVTVEPEAASSCLDTAAVAQCDADFSSCDSIGANKCECFDALRECYTKASCSAAVMWDMATQCTTAGCNAATCTGQSLFSNLRGQA